MRGAVLGLAAFLLAASPAMAQFDDLPPGQRAGQTAVLDDSVAPPVPQPPPPPKVEPLPQPRFDAAALGPLRYRGGVQLTGGDGFRGYAGLWVDAEGWRLIAVEGRAWISGQISYDKAGDLSGFLPTNHGFLFDQRGLPFKAEDDGRAQALAYEDVRLTFDTGPQFLVGFGGGNGRIAAYKGITSRAVPMDLPAEARAASGFTALAAFADGGGFLALAADGHGWLSTPKGSGAVSLRTDSGWSPAALTALPGGDLLIVERRGDDARLSRIPASSVTGGATLRPIELATLPGKAIAGASAREGPKGEAFIYLISDGSPAALYMFELVGK